jgi:phage baseplate assembly protein W
MASDIYGQGIATPLRQGVTGLAVSSGVDRVEQSIRVILGTQHGERVMRPTFGCNLNSLVFAPNTTATANLARYYVESGLAQWEPRIEVLAVDVTNDHVEGALVITIAYRLRATGQTRTLVFPFSLETGQ